MSVFVFVWDFLGLQTGDETDDLQTLKEKAGQVCTLSHDEQTEQYDKKMESLPDGRKTNKPFAQCFNSAFAYHLLSNGYKMPVVDTPIEVYYDINGKSVEWSLGMMLVEAVSIQCCVKYLQLEYSSEELHDDLIWLFLSTTHSSYLFCTPNLEQ